jgi:hypothetical protein
VWWAIGLSDESFFDLSHVAAGGKLPLPQIIHTYRISMFGGAGLYYNTSRLDIYVVNHVWPFAAFSAISI